MLRHAVLLVLLAVLPVRSAAAIDALVRGGDGALWLVPEAGAGTPLGGRIVGTPGAAARDGSLVVVVRGTDDALWTLTRTRGAWDVAFRRVGGTITGAPSAAWRGDVLEVVARGTDGGCWRASRTGETWSAWEPLGGEFAERATFAVASRTPGSLDVFARGLDGLLWHAQLGSRGWSPFESMGGSRLGSDPAACSRGGGLDVVSLAADSSAQLLSWTPSGGWGRWISLGGTLAAGTSLGVAAETPDRLVVAGIGADERLVVGSVDGGRFSGWRTASGEGRPASSATPIPATAGALVPGVALQPLGGSSPRDPGVIAEVSPGAIAAAAAGTPAIPSVEASALLDLDPSTLVRFGQPRLPGAGMRLDAEQIARLGRANDAPFPGCGGDDACLRVTLLGFRLLEPTGDPSPDGPGDEIALRAESWWSPTGSWSSGEPMMRETLVHGSRPSSASGSAAGRVRAGSASADGGMARGDAWPSPVPATGPGGADRRLPLTIFEGPLPARGTLRVSLSAWEVDGGEGPSACCRDWNSWALAADLAGGTGQAAVPVTAPLSRIERADRPYGLFVLDPSERAIGGGADALVVVPQLGETLTDWRALAARTGLRGPGVIALDLSDRGAPARLVAYVHVQVND